MAAVVIVQRIVFKGKRLRRSLETGWVAWFIFKFIEDWRLGQELEHFLRTAKDMKRSAGLGWWPMLNPNKGLMIGE